MSMSIPLKMHSAAEKKTEAVANKAIIKPTTEHHNLLVHATEQKKKKMTCLLKRVFKKKYFTVLPRFLKGTDELGGFHTAYSVFVSR